MASSLPLSDQPSPRLALAPRPHLSFSLSSQSTKLLSGKGKCSPSKRWIQKRLPRIRSGRLATSKVNEDCMTHLAATSWDLGRNNNLQGIPDLSFPDKGSDVFTSRAQLRNSDTQDGGREGERTLWYSPRLGKSITSPTTTPPPLPWLGSCAIKSTKNPEGSTGPRREAATTWRGQPTALYLPTKPDRRWWRTMTLGP